MMISGAGRNQGRRGYMEDVDFSFDGIRVTDKRTISVFGVLDGHGGKDCAQFAADEVPTKMAALLRSGKSCQEAMFRSIVETDREFLRTSRSNGSGSTANVMLWDHFSETVYIANTADTR
jgi:protein phosphatase 1L